MDLDQLLHDTAHVDVGPLPAWAPPVEERRRLVTPLRASVAAVVAAAAIIAPTISFGGPGSNPPATASAASKVLHRAAVGARSQPDGGWKDAAYWQSVSTYTSGGTTQHREVWIAHHGEGALRDPGLDPGVIPLDGDNTISGVSWDDLWTLPTDTAALRAKVRELAGSAGNSVDQEMFVVVADMLRESPAPPKLRAALYEVTATIPGVKYLGPTTDSAGRSGIAVSRDDQTLVLDPSDGKLLEDREGDGTAAPVPLKDDSGKVIGSYSAWIGTYFDQGPSETAPAPTPGSESKALLDGKPVTP